MLYVGFEIRQNSATLEAARFQAVSDSITERAVGIARDPELTRIYVPGLGRGADKLDDVESDQLNLLMVAIVRRLEGIYFQTP